MKQKNKMLKLCLYGAVLIFLTFYLHSGIPTGINYQGRYEENGQPVTGVRTFRFDLYNAPTGGTLLWTSGNVDINVVDGLFNYVLNCSNIDWRNNDVYLEITVGGTTLSPRERIQASAYAFYSSSASYAYKAGSGGDSVDVSVAGTTNRVCKFVGSRTIGNSILTDDGTNVGIGTTSPSQKLEVYGGNISITRPSGDTSSAVLWLDQQNATQGGKYAIVARNTGEFAIYDGKTAKDRVYISTNGQVGIGTTVPDKPLTIQGIGTHHELVSFKDSTGTTKWHLNLRNSAGLNLAETGVADGRLFIAYGGNVGIGTTSPATALHVYRATVTATAFASDEYDVMIKPRNNSYAHVRNKDDTDYRGVACYNLYISSSGTYIDGSVVAGETAGYLTIKDGVNIRGNVNIAHTSNPGIELRDTDGGTPYIDFSLNTTADYHGRILCNTDQDFEVYATGGECFYKNTDVYIIWNTGVPWLLLRRSGTDVAADLGGRIIFQAPLDTAGTIASYAYIDGKREDATSGSTAGYLSFYTRPSGVPIAETLRITSGGHVLPRRAAGTQNLGDATYYWNDISCKTLTDRGCLGWFDEGVELQDGRKVSDLEALKCIKPHPKKKTVYGVPMLDYKTLPKVVYKPAMVDGKLLPRDENDEPYYETVEVVEMRDKDGNPILDEHGKPKVEYRKIRRPAADGAELTSLISIMIGAIKELDAKIQELQTKLDSLQQR